MSFVIEPNRQPSVPVLGTDDQFPVHRIYCVGRNYADHVKEMGGDPKSEPPIFFSKPADAIVINNEDVRYPLATSDLHHEVELVIALKSGGENIDSKYALDCVYGYAVGIDFTRRDLQAVAKNQGRPWDVAKGFDQSAPISAINPKLVNSSPEQGVIRLEVNGETRQEGDLKQMIWSVAEIIAELSTLYCLRAGDLIYSGTPSGVAAVDKGDILHAEVEGIAVLSCRLV